MNSQLEQIEQGIKKALLGNVGVELRGKEVVRGRLMFYEFKDFNYKLTFEGSKKFEFPYPYKAEIEDNQLTFYYHNKHLHFDDPIEKFKMQNCLKSLKNKFHNSTLVITIHT